MRITHAITLSIMPENFSTERDAPPTRAQSIFSALNRDALLLALTDPPY